MTSLVSVDLLLGVRELEPLGVANERERQLRVVCRLTICAIKRPLFRNDCYHTTLCSEGHLVKRFPLLVWADLDGYFLIHPFQKFEQFIRGKTVEMTV